MKAELRQRILAYNKENEQDKERAEDFMALLSALPKGQVKNLLKDETCAKILDKYGITGWE